MSCINVKHLWFNDPIIATAPSAAMAEPSQQYQQSDSSNSGQMMGNIRPGISIKPEDSSGSRPKLLGVTGTGGVKVVLEFDGHVQPTWESGWLSSAEFFMLEGAQEALKEYNREEEQRI
jgi:hypothetical protein